MLTNFGGPIEPQFHSGGCCGPNRKNPVDLKTTAEHIDMILTFEGLVL